MLPVNPALLFPGSQSYSQCLSRRRRCSWWQILVATLTESLLPETSNLADISNRARRSERVVDCFSEAFGEDPVLKDDDGDALIYAETSIDPPPHHYRTDHRT